MFTQAEPKPLFPEVQTFHDLITGFSKRKSERPIATYISNETDSDGDRPTMKIGKLLVIHNGGEIKHCYVKGLVKGILPRLRPNLIFCNWDTSHFKMIVGKETTDIYYNYGQIIGSVLLATIKTAPIPL